MLPGVCKHLSEGKSDGSDLGQHSSPDTPGLGGDPVHFGSGYGSGRDVLALEQGIEGNCPLARVEINANQVTAITYRLAKLRN
jgi:hypothetical protein